MRKYFIYLAIIISISQLTACVKVEQDKAKYITQCITLPDKNSKSRQFETLFDGNKTQCHALLWRVPEQYSVEERNKYGTDSSDDSIAGSLLITFPDNAKQMSMPNLEVRILSSWGTVDFTRREKGLGVTGGLFYQKQVNSSFNGMFVYATDDSRVSKEIKKVSLVSPEPWRYLIECDYEYNYSYKNIPPNTLCHVITDVDNRVHAEFNIHYSQLNDFEKINQSVIKTIRSMMLN